MRGCRLMPEAREHQQKNIRLLLIVLSNIFSVTVTELFCVGFQGNTPNQEQDIKQILFEGLTLNLIVRSWYSPFFSLRHTNMNLIP